VSGGSRSAVSWAEIDTHTYTNKQTHIHTQTNTHTHTQTNTHTHTNTKGQQGDLETPLYLFV